MERTRSKWALRGLSLVIAITAAAAAAATVARGAWNAPALVAAHLPPPPLRSVRELSPDHERMLLAVEDPKFLSHHGVDFRSPGAGWTTITQGLVKVLYFESFRPGALAKLEQTLLAIGFDAVTPKRCQLDLFWNLAYCGTVGGEDVAGLPRASVVYFDRDVTQLERGQYLALVAMLMAPNRYSPIRHPASSAERVPRIERFLAGRCRDVSWRDVDYTACRDNRSESQLIP